MNNFHALHQLKYRYNIDGDDNTIAEILNIIKDKEYSWQKLVKKSIFYGKNKQYRKWKNIIERGYNIEYGNSRMEVIVKIYNKQTRICTFH